MFKRGIQSFILLFLIILGFKHILSDDASFRMIVTRNDQEVGGEFHADLEMRIIVGTDTNTLHSMTADIYYGSGLTEWGSDPVVEWGVWETDSSYFRTVGKLSGCYRVLITQGDTFGVNWRENVSLPGDPEGWDVRMVWKKIVTLRWQIAALISPSLTINDNTDAAAHFENEQNIPYAITKAVSWNVTNEDVSNPVLVKTKIYLEGPYDSSGDTMTTNLSENDYIPIDSPYSDDSRNIAAIPDSAVDWILVQIRSVSDGSALDSRSAFLSKNGYVFESNGLKGISLDASNGDYYIVIKHRHHLTVMSSAAVGLYSTSSTFYNYTTSIDQFFDSGGAKEVEIGVWGMYGGNADNSDQDIFPSDLAVIKLGMLSGLYGYHIEDVDMDGDVFPSDYALSKINMLQGAYSVVPNP